MMYTIRSIEPRDDKIIASVIRAVLVEMGVPKVGTAYEDASLDKMFKTYDKKGCKYFVVVKDDKVLGGGGIAPLAGGDMDVCELQKMYFLKEVRGKGLGKQVIENCMDFAKHSGYRKIYLETMPYMEAARKLYKKLGFISLKEPIGDTGHYSCQEWMIKEL